MTAERPGSRAEELDSTVLRTLSIKVKFAIVKLNIKNMKRLGSPGWASGQDFMLPGSGGWVQSLIGELRSQEQVKVKVSQLCSTLCDLSTAKKQTKKQNMKRLERLHMSKDAQTAF